MKAYLSTDHVTAATGKTIAVTISKNGAAFGNPSAGATNATEIASGWYTVDLSTTDTGTLGPLLVRGTSSGVDDVELEYQVVDANSLGAAYLDAAITSRLASTQGLIIKKNASVVFPFFLVSSTDHVTPKTGATVTATRSIDGAAFGSCANSVSEISGGFYKITLAAADVNGTAIALNFAATGADTRAITVFTQA